MRRALAIGLLVVVALLVVAQLVLPGAAERRLRDRLSRDGKVTRVEVHSFPAIKLLWNQADRVVVRMSSASAGTGRVADLLATTGDAGSRSGVAAAASSDANSGRGEAGRRRLHKWRR